MKMGIRGKLISVFVILITVPLIFLGVAAHKKSLNIIEKDLKELSVSTLEGIEISIDNYLKGFEDSLDMLANNVDLKEILNHPNYEPFMIGLFQGVIDSHKDVISVYMGTKDKQMFTYPQAEYSEDFDPTTRPWYKNAYEKKITSWTQPYVDVHTNKLVVTVSSPVYDENNEFVGVVAMDVLLDSLSNNISKMKIGNNGYPFIVDANGNFMTHKNKSKIGNKLKTKEIVEAMAKEKTGDVVYELNENGKIRKKFAAFRKMNKTGWTIFGSLYLDEILDRAHDMIYTIVLIGGMLLVGAIIVAYVFSKSLTSTIHKLISDMEKIKEGDLTVRSDIKTDDELGKLASNFNDTIDTLSNLIKNIKEVSHEVRNSSENLAATAQETSATSDQVAMTVEQIAKGALSQAEDAEKGVELVNRLSDKLNELTDNTNDMFVSAENVVNSNLQGFEAVEDLKQKTDQNINTTKMIESAVLALNDKSKNIREILDTITSIAEQTNLLALNASIEVARAGEHGRGFAVVADEIRKLAEGSRNAADEIKNIVENIQKDSQNTVEIMNEVKKVSSEQADAVSKVNSSFDVISRSVGDITYKISSIKEFVNNMNEEKDLIVASIQNISAVSEESASSSEEVSASMNEQALAIEEVAKAADKLNGLSMKLNEEIKIFKI
ncbi:methyl-accepting chemotaxis protein [Tepidibacter thalassicus]|uniref:Methyl-accepting chemotaxis protein n=1 Tax=Tepidibacter thalassicus DSM 15285 TaxID=1123350 RepID=A0A1M5TPB9_9FIRM|nr:methyl-accepting chemotaxis protein [Tepidibacter thalassicus]SHH52665.1 methyl-accepting chemotaxis protein [Tepidibacter thalassicus DSM 15285]